MKATLIAIALAAATATAVASLAKPAADPDTLYAQAAPPMGDQRGGEGDRGNREGGRWQIMHGMMHGTMRRDPQRWCLDRLAHRAARRAYIEVKLNLTAEQQPLWDKVQSVAQAEEQQERQLCASLKPGAEPTFLERMDRMQQLLQARLTGLQNAKPAVQALYQALTPEQQAILNSPRRFGGR
jgi:Spy/CpxP family protein refolding chaperone